MATQLLQLPEVTRLSSRVIRILGGNPGKVSSSLAVANDNHLITSAVYAPRYLSASALFSGQSTHTGKVPTRTSLGQANREF